MSNSINRFIKTNFKFTTFFSKLALSEKINDSDYVEDAEDEDNTNMLSLSGMGILSLWADFRPFQNPK